MPPKIHVVAGILFNERGEFLLSSRPEGKPYAGYWEFAGGKVEAGETEFAALQREFMEELGIEITHATPWLAKFYRYEHAHVNLRFFRVAAHEWRGKLQAREQQQWAWQKAGDFTVSPMLPANGPLLKALSVPRSFTGRPDTGLEGENASGAYRVVPFGLAEPQHKHILIDEAVLRARGRMPEAESVWVKIQTASQWPHVQDADVVLWQVGNREAAEAVCGVLAGGVSMPLVVAATPEWNASYRRRWLDAGAHAVLACEETEAV